MASMFIRHRVADFARWKEGFDQHQPVRERYGVSASSVHRDVDDPSIVIVAAKFSDSRRAKEFAGSPDLRAAMEQAGVEGPPEIWIAEDV